MWILYVALAAAVAVAVLLIINKSKKKKAEFKKFLSEPEPAFVQFAIPKKFAYSSEFERLINERFSDYVASCNEFLKETQHLEYLKKRREAYQALKSSKAAKAEKLVLESEKKVADFRSVMEKIHWYNYSVKDAPGELVELFNAFREVNAYLPSNKIPPEPMQSFAPKGKKWIELSSGNWIMLSEFYAVQYNSHDFTIKILDYKSVETKSDYTVKQLPFGTLPSKDDEIAGKHWKYEDEKGSPDKKYQNNPTRIDVFKGYLIIGIGGKTTRIDYGNKTTAVALDKKLSTHKKEVVSSRISRYVNFILSSNELFFKLSDINTRIIAKNQLDAKKKEEQKKEEQDKREAERKAALEKKKAEAEEKKIREAEAKRRELEEKAEKEKKARETEARAAADAVKREENQDEKRFSDEEINMILEARRKKEEDGKREALLRSIRERAAKLDSHGEPPISQIGGTRVITNNLADFNYEVTEGDFKNGLELVFVDGAGEVISQTFRSEPLTVGDNFTASFEMLPNIDFDSQKTYYLFVKLPGAEEPIGKLDYNIKISFVSDFDF